MTMHLRTREPRWKTYARGLYADVMESIGFVAFVVLFGAAVVGSVWIVRESAYKDGVADGRFEERQKREATAEYENGLLKVRR